MVFIAGSPSAISVPCGPAGSAGAASRRRQRIVPGKSHRRIRADTRDGLVDFRMRLEEHRLQRVDQRRVEKIDPIAGRVRFIAVAVPGPVRRQQHIARPHHQLDAVDNRIGAGLRIDHEAQRIGRVAVRARLLAGKDHLIGGEQRARGGVFVSPERGCRGSDCAARQARC